MGYSNGAIFIPAIFFGIMFMVFLISLADEFMFNEPRKERVAISALGIIFFPILGIISFCYPLYGLNTPEPNVEVVEKHIIDNKWVSDDLHNLHLYITEIIDEDTVIEKLTFKDHYHKCYTWKPNQYFTYRIKKDDTKATD